MILALSRQRLPLLAERFGGAAPGGYRGLDVAAVDPDMGQHPDPAADHGDQQALGCLVCLCQAAGAIAGRRHVGEHDVVSRRLAGSRLPGSNSATPSARMRAF